jgi:hypothetical protein
MAIVYGAQAFPYIEFDGTNIQEIFDAFCPPEAVIDGADRIYLSGTGSGDYDITFQSGDLATWGLSKVTASDWAIKYVKV